MHVLHGSIAMLTLLGSVRCEAEPVPAPPQARAVLAAGELHLFSEEDVRLACSVPEDPSTSWRFQWFLNGVSVSSAQVYDLQKARVLQTGSYTCQAEKDTDDWPFRMTSLQSDPVDVHVDGGWVLLQTLTEPLIVDEELTLTCRVRDDPVLAEVTFYKGNVTIRRQKVKDLVFPRVTVEHQGTYSCKATWVQGYEYHSAQSLKSSVTVLDKLTSPVLKVESSQPDTTEGSRMVLKCSTRLNSREKGLSLEYYYLKNGTRLSPSSSHDTYTIQRVERDDTGIYVCRVRVRALNLERWSNELKVEVKPRR